MIQATFSEAMDAGSIDEDSFTLSGPDGSVPGIVSYEAMVVSFATSGDLAPNTTYTATIGSGVTDTVGKPMEAAASWTFTTGAAADVSPPFVTARSPEPDAVEVAIDIGYISVSFEQASTHVSDGSSAFESEATAQVNGSSFSFEARSRRMESSEDLAGAWAMGASKIDVSGVPPGTVIPMRIVVLGSFNGPSGTLMLQVRDFDNYRMLGSMEVSGSGHPFVFEGQSYPAITYLQMIDPYGSQEDGSNYLETTANGSGGYQLDFLYPAISVAVLSIRCSINDEFL